MFANLIWSFHHQNIKTPILHHFQVHTRLSYYFIKFLSHFSIILSFVNSYTLMGWFPSISNHHTPNSLTISPIHVSLHFLVHVQHRYTVPFEFRVIWAFLFVLEIHSSSLDVPQVIWIINFAFPSINHRIRIPASRSFAVLHNLIIARFQWVLVQIGLWFSFIASWRSFQHF